MAIRTRSKPKGGLQVRRVNNAKERRTGGFFMRLKTDEWMKAYALFTPDPEADKNPGYYEYFEHYDNSNSQYVPCAGDDCYMCELGENPSVRALTLWYFPDNANGEKLKVLKLNGYMIRDFGEIEAEEGGVLGKRFRIKRLSDKGEYRVSPLTDKPLMKREISALLKEAASKDAGENKGSGPIDFEELALKQLKSALAKVDAVNGLTDSDDDDEDDEDEEEDEKPKARRGKAKAQPEPEDDEEEDDEEDEDEEEEEDEDEDENEDDEEEDEEEEDDEDEEEEEEEEDEEEDDDEEAEDDDEEEEDENPSMTKEKFTVVSTNESDETVTVKLDGKNTKLWLGTGVEADWDVVKKGAEIIVDAITDDEGDWVLSSLKVAPAARTRRAATKTAGTKTRTARKTTTRK